MSKNNAESIRARLLNIAKTENSDFQVILIRYSLERFLYRISISDYAHRFLLKGALLFSLWYEMSHRSTRDIDLLAYGESDLKSMDIIFKNIAKINFDDGLIFHHDKIVVEDIRKNTGYVGARVIIQAELAKARVRIQIDIGFGDAVTPKAMIETFPVILKDFPAARLRAYPVYTVIAEKLHAIALLGMSNSRLKDYFDLLILFQREKLNSAILSEAIFATFTRRKMQVTNKTLIGLSDEFSNDLSKQLIWNAFLKNNQLEERPLSSVISILKKNLEPILEMVAAKMKKIKSELLI